MRRRTAVFLALLFALPAAAEARRRAHVYTNDDLARVSPLRGQTGVLSEAAAAGPRPAAAPRDERGSDRAREGYWRREADRVRERVRPLEKRAATLRRQIDERWRLPGVAARTDPKLVEWRRELREAEAEIREHQDRLEERARREGAMPGWLR
ncbi:MAG TPA: hypothetical protein VFM88_07395 [Vicinamibacteria bacterium]|nr:hypothetical protein [Vicinamibacteria bacterium]